MKNDRYYSMSIEEVKQKVEEIIKKAKGEVKC